MKWIGEAPAFRAPPPPSFLISLFRRCGAPPFAMAATLQLGVAQLRVLVAVAFLCLVSAAGNGENEAGAMGVGFPSRHLLQTVQPCPVDFATQNYTVVTSVCNGTNPNTTLCCEAFVIFACPFAQYINDESTSCATTMFSYLNMAGNYPPQLFQTCQGDQNGLPCPLVPEPSPNPSSAFSMDESGRFTSLVILLMTLKIWV